MSRILRSIAPATLRKPGSIGCAQGGQAEPWQPAWVSIWPWGANVRFVGRGLVARFSDEDLAYYEWLRIEAPPADPLNTP